MSGKVYRGENGGEFQVIGPLAYMGKKDCKDVRCRRMGWSRDADGTLQLGECVGWHCSYCDEPCGSQGHGCDAARAVLGEARRIVEESA